MQGLPSKRRLLLERAALVRCELRPGAPHRVPWAMCAGEQVHRATHQGPRHLSGMVLGRNANSSPTSSYHQSELTIDTAGKVCNRTRRASMPTPAHADHCLSSLQLVEDLAPASKVVEMVETRAHCPLQDCFLCYGLGVYCERCRVLVRPRRSVEWRVWPPRGGVIGVIWPCSWPHGGLCVDAISIKGMSFSSVFIYFPPTCSAKPDTSAVKLESGPKYRFLWPD